MIQINMKNYVVEGAVGQTPNWVQSKREREHIAVPYIFCKIVVYNINKARM